MDVPWLLDELAHAGHEHLDAAFVAGYDRKQAFDPSDDLAELRRHGLSADSTLVDMATGTGTLALAAAPHCRRIVAVDVSPVMLAVQREKAASAGLRNVETVQAGFLSYEHRGAPPDLVYTRNALHQLPDFWKGIALARLAALLPPGGVLLVRDLIYDFRPAEAEAVFARWLEGAVADSAIGYTAADFAEHIRGEFSTYRWLFEPLLAAAGFEIVATEYRRSVYGAYTCVKR